MSRNLVTTVSIAVTFFVSCVTKKRHWKFSEEEKRSYWKWGQMVEVRAHGGHVFSTNNDLYSICYLSTRTGNLIHPRKSNTS